MVTREMNGYKMILPIWHKVTKNDVINFSAALADKVALNTSLNSIEEIAKQLAEVILEDYITNTRSGTSRNCVNFKLLSVD